MTAINLKTAFALLLVFVTGVASTAQALSNRVTFPEDFDQMVMYGDYRRGSGGELAYALPETLRISKSGEPLPAGTRLVLEIYSGGSLTDYFVMEKGQGWGQEVSEEFRTGDWHFQQFDTDKQVRRTAIAERCETCHQGAARNDFLFTYDRMLSFVP